jgi:hypothetical protein
VVALGNPNDPVPPYGAARGYFAHGNWRDGVTSLAASAQAIVICLEDSEGVWWEAEHLLSGPHVEKTLFLLHPRFAPPPTNREFIERLLARVPAIVTRRDVFLHAGSARRSKAAATSVVGFFTDTDGALHIGMSSSCSRFLMVHWFLRARADLLPPHRAGLNIHAEHLNRISEGSELRRGFQS